MGKEDSIYLNKLRNSLLIIGFLMIWQSKVESVPEFKSGIGLGIFTTIKLYDYKGEPWNFYENKLAASMYFKMEIDIKKIVMGIDMFVGGFSIFPYNAVYNGEKVVKAGAGFWNCNIWSGYYIEKIDIVPLVGGIYTIRAGILEVKNANTGEIYSPVDYEDRDINFLCGIKFEHLLSFVSTNKSPFYNLSGKYMVIPKENFHIVNCEFLFPPGKVLQSTLGVEVYLHRSLKGYFLYLAFREI